MTAGVEEIFFEISGEEIFGNLVLAEAPGIANASAAMAEVQLRRWFETRCAGTIFIAQWRHYGRERDAGVYLTQQLLDGFFAFGICAFAKVREAQITFLVEQVLGGPAAVREGFPDFVI